MNTKPQKYDAFNARPFVGYISSGESVEFIKEGGNLICRQAKGATLLMGGIAALLLLSTGFAVTSPDMARYVREFQHANLMGKLGMGLVALLLLWIVGMTLTFSLEKLFENKRIIVDGFGRINLHTGSNAAPQRVIRPDQINALNLDVVTFQGKRQTHTCFILVLKLNTQEQTVLCCGADKQALAQFASEVAQRCHVQLTEEAVSA